MPYNNIDQADHWKFASAREVFDSDLQPTVLREFLRVWTGG